MLRNSTLHTGHVAICGPFPQQGNAEIPLLDGDVLLDHHLRFLPVHEASLAGYLFENGYLASGDGSWIGDSRIRAVFLAELFVARP